MPADFKSESINLSIFSSSVFTLPPLPPRPNNMILFLPKKRGGGPDMTCQPLGKILFILPGKLDRKF